MKPEHMIEQNELTTRRVELAQAEREIEDRLRTLNTTDPGSPESFQGLSPIERYDKICDSIRELPRNDRLSDEWVCITPLFEIDIEHEGRKETIWVYFFVQGNEDTNNEKIKSAGASWDFIEPSKAHPGTRYGEEVKKMHVEMADDPESENVNILSSLSNLEWTLNICQEALKPKSPEPEPF